MITPGQEKLKIWRDHPSQMVRDLFRIEPDPWQVEVLEAFPHNQLMAMTAAKGPGKTGVLAWLCWNFLLTRPHPNIGAVSISRQNLDDGLWKEMAKWRDKSPLLQAKFSLTADRISCDDAPKTWFMAAKTYSQSANKEQQANTLAGFHADYIMFVLDESGGMTDNVMVAAEAALSSCIEGHIVQAGNPTHLEGPLYRAANINRKSATQPNGWWVLEITGDPDDPKRSPRISIEWARGQIEQWGRDNPWVLVNVFGKFPPSSLNALIGPQQVRDAMKRYYRPYELEGFPRVIGVDVAGDGADLNVIMPRHGIQVFKPVVIRNASSIQGAGQIARLDEEFKSDAIFIDNTGGFGAGWADQLDSLGRSPIRVHFSGKAHKETRYTNKRTEMYFEAIEWIKNGGALPDCEEFVAELSQTTYYFDKDKLALEPKALVKAKIGRSPDHADALALCFAESVVSKNRNVKGISPRHQIDYDPYAEFTKDVAKMNARHQTEYDPYRR